MNLQFTAASNADIQMIFSQAKELIDSYEDIASIDYEKVLAWTQKKITNNIGAYTRVTLDGKPCACYRLCPDGEVDDLYVLPAFQNRGIGSAIMQKILKESNEPLYLYVFSRNTGAIAFYKRFGFSLKEMVGNTRLILHRKG